MANADTKLPTAHDEAGGLERVRYFTGQFLAADDFRTEQEYFREKLRRHNRFLHGWGVVSGLDVRVDPDAGPLVVTVCPGYALGPQGDEIYVAAPARLDLFASLSQPADPYSTATVTGKVIIAVEIRYAEFPSRPTVTLFDEDGRERNDTEFSRLRDGFELRWSIKSTVSPASSPSSDGWVELATLTVLRPVPGATPVLDDRLIDNGTRRIVASTAESQRQPGR